MQKLSSYIKKNITKHLLHCPRFKIPRTPFLQIVNIVNHKIFWNEVRGIYISPDKTNGKKISSFEDSINSSFGARKGISNKQYRLDIVCVEEFIILETFPLNFFHIFFSDFLLRI